MNGRFQWKGTDLTAFTSRFSKDEGRPIGTIHAKIDVIRVAIPYRTRY